VHSIRFVDNRGLTTKLDGRSGYFKAMCDDSGKGTTFVVPPESGLGRASAPAVGGSRWCLMAVEKSEPQRLKPRHL
jgi:hypothetical protein